MAVQFDEAYYNDLWGTVHRHDYVLSRAGYLVQKYGNVRILDIGTGCGALVKVLREMGCDAWGAEIGQYALDNTCAPGYVVHGDLRDIPFKDKRFDVVTSQGVWVYLSKDEIPHALEECWRVGTYQEHNIDLRGSEIGEEGFVTAETLEWWQANVYNPVVLLTCPTHIVKEYSFQRWINAVKAIRYPLVEVFVVDNSPNGEMKARYGDQVPIEWIEVPQEHPYERINLSMEVIRRKFVEGQYARWFNLECDVIPDPDILDILIAQKADWIGHAYPLRGEAREWSSGIGCSLIRRKLAKKYDFVHAGANSPDGWLWEEVRGIGEFKTVEMWGHTKIQHLKE